MERLGPQRGYKYDAMEWRRFRRAVAAVLGLCGASTAALPLPPFVDTVETLCDGCGIICAMLAEKDSCKFVVRSIWSGDALLTSSRCWANLERSRQGSDQEDGDTRWAMSPDGAYVAMVHGGGELTVWSAAAVCRAQQRKAKQEPSMMDGLLGLAKLGSDIQYDNLPLITRSQLGEALLIALIIDTGVLQVWRYDLYAVSSAPQQLTKVIEHRQSGDGSVEAAAWLAPSQLIFAGYPGSDVSNNDEAGAPCFVWDLCTNAVTHVKISSGIPTMFDDELNWDLTTMNAWAPNHIAAWDGKGKIVIIDVKRKEVAVASSVDCQFRERDLSRQTITKFEDNLVAYHSECRKRVLNFYEIGPTQAFRGAFAVSFTEQCVGCVVWQPPGVATAEANQLCSEVN